MTEKDRDRGSRRKGRVTTVPVLGEDCRRTFPKPTHLCLGLPVRVLKNFRLTIVYILTKYFGVLSWSWAGVFLTF